MLILVTVTINFALNGGLITRSKQASLEMQKAADLEELQLAVISSMDYTTGEVVREDLVSSLSSGWNVTSTAPYVCMSPSGNTFTVSEAGVINDTAQNIATGDSTENNTGNNNGGVVKSKELLPTQEEKASFGELNDGMTPVAVNSAGTIIVGYMDYSDYNLNTDNEIRVIVIYVTTSMYVFAVDSVSATNYPSMLLGGSYQSLNSMIEKTWYRGVPGEGNSIDFSVYEDAQTFGDNMCPISLEDFEGGTIYSSSYLERVINSF